ncbi:MAG: hypothetical protein JWO51_4230 [Rhodospirillales bacterium]|nr:hypothetical protein [Rhodospirillales bacterium]
MMPDKPDMIIYGTGTVAERFLGSRSGLGTVWFASTNGGGEFHGQKILPAAAIARYPEAAVIVASSFRRQILETLTAIGIPDCQVSWYIAEQDRLASTDEIRSLWSEHASAASLRDRTKLLLHHVGGRGFGVALTAPAYFDRDLAYVLYEADADCARDMIEANPHENFHVLPYCLGRQSGPARLKIMSNACNSSLLDPAPEYGSYGCEVSLVGREGDMDVTGARYDVSFGNEIRVVRSVDVETRALDDLIGDGKLPYGAPPDVLSLDTQGSELDILLGARQTVRTGVLALATEIGFHALYRNQALFARLLDFADEEGFHFVSFASLQEISPFRAPVGQRGKGFIGFGDAMFLRRIETLDQLSPQPETRRIIGYKLAFIAVTLGHLEYAVQALDYADRQPGRSDELAATSYGPFLDRFRAIGKTMPPLYLNGERADLIDRMRRQDFPSSTTPSLAGPTTPLETLLTEHGFADIARIVRDRRLQGLPFALPAADSAPQGHFPS